ncbi:MAG: hypothetical protein HUK22_01605 [Thermoguttaceae bacterium]|nr:hypothetical protein [Thermoguttaceae bacterium]
MRSNSDSAYQQAISVISTIFWQAYLCEEPNALVYLQSAPPRATWGPAAFEKR